MFKLSKKILNSIAVSCILGICIFTIGKTDLKILPTSSLPIAEHIVVLDAGHGQPDRWSCK